MLSQPPSPSFTTCTLSFSSMLTLHDDPCARPRCPGTWACWCSDCCSPGRVVSRSRGKRDSVWLCVPLFSSPLPHRSYSSNSPSRKRELDPRMPSVGPCTLSLHEIKRQSRQGTSLSRSSLCFLSRDRSHA